MSYRTETREVMVDEVTRKVIGWVSPDGRPQEVPSLVAGGGNFPLAGRVQRVAAIGDSITKGGSAYNSESDKGHGILSMVNHVCWQSAGRLVMVRNAGVDGDTTAQMLARFDADIPAGVTLGIVQGGTNDIGVVAQSVTVANISAIAAKFMAFGAMPVIVAVPPKNAAPTAVMALNRALAIEAARIGARFCNPWNAFTNGDGTYKSGASADGVHPSVATAQTCGAVLLTQLFATATPAEVPFFLPVENADPAGVAYTGGTANSCLMTDSNADGLPDGWLAAAAEVVTTLPAATVPAVGKTLVATGTAVSTERKVQLPVATAALTPGARYALVARYETSGTVSGGLLTQLALVTTGLQILPVMYSTVAVDQAAVIVFVFTAQSPAATAYLQLCCKPVSGTGSGVMKLSQAQIYPAAVLGLT